MTNQEKIKQLEESGHLDSNCKMCIEIFYHYYLNIWREGEFKPSPFAPMHKASSRCQSGKNNHCTCDVCF